MEEWTRRRILDVVNAVTTDEDKQSFSTFANHMKRLNKILKMMDEFLDGRPKTDESVTWAIERVEAVLKEEQKVERKKLRKLVFALGCIVVVAFSFFVLALW